MSKQTEKMEATGNRRRKNELESKNVSDGEKEKEERANRRRAKSQWVIRER